MNCRADAPVALFRTLLRSPGSLAAPPNLLHTTAGCNDDRVHQRHYLSLRSSKLLDAAPDGSIGRAHEEVNVKPDNRSHLHKHTSISTSGVWATNSRRCYRFLICGCELFVVVVFFQPTQQRSQSCVSLHRCHDAVDSDRTLSVLTSITSCCVLCAVFAAVELVPLSLSLSPSF